MRGCFRLAAAGLGGVGDLIQGYAVKVQIAVIDRAAVQMGQLRFEGLHGFVVQLLSLHGQFILSQAVIRISVKIRSLRHP
ncbi:hypothetical protein D3C71_1101380 [compost metagenome]